MWDLRPFFLLGAFFPQRAFFSLLKKWKICPSILWKKRPQFVKKEPLCGKIAPFVEKTPPDESGKSALHLWKIRPHLWKKSPNCEKSAPLWKKRPKCGKNAPGREKPFWYTKLRIQFTKFKIWYTKLNLVSKFSNEHYFQFSLLVLKLTWTSLTSSLNKP